MSDRSGKKLYLGTDLNETLARAAELINEGHRITIRRGYDVWRRTDGTYIMTYNETERIAFQKEAT